MDNNQKMIAYLEYLEVSLYTNYEDQANATFQIYREDTADGYEVFIAKYATDKNTYVNRDIYYYEHDFSDLVIEKLQDGEDVYVDDDIFNDNYIEDALADAYDEEMTELEDEKDD